MKKSTNKAAMSKTTTKPTAPNKKAVVGKLPKMTKGGSKKAC